jgi:DNA-binding response OmpR family regulator
MCRVLIVADRETFGPHLEAILKKLNLDSTIVESYGRLSDILDELGRTEYDLVLLKNNRH